MTNTVWSYGQINKKNTTHSNYRIYRPRVHFNSSNKQERCDDGSSQYCWNQKYYYSKYKFQLKNRQEMKCMLNGPNVKMFVIFICCGGCIPLKSTHTVSAGNRKINTNMKRKLERQTSDTVEEKTTRKERCNCYYFINFRIIFMSDILFGFAWSVSFLAQLPQNQTASPLVPRSVMCKC